MAAMSSTPSARRTCSRTKWRPRPKRLRGSRKPRPSSLALARAVGALRGLRGDAPGAVNQVVTALRGIYRTPWEVALQRWMESVAPGERTFARPSRRGADRADVVLPGAGARAGC
jgi:hypothetical protein